jgi:cyclophilin family peptidyl-prolyl cis-trans isomerase
MANALSQPKFILIGLTLMLLASVGLMISGYRIPSVAKLSTNNTNTPMTYPFTDKVTKEDITGKQVRITTKYGDIVFKLDNPEQAPLATSSFVYLAKQKYFDGLTFHRVEPGFVIQGGDPNGTGTGGPGYQFADEPVTQDYTEGTVAMANAGVDTNGSQFFIMLADTPSLPKKYTIFGHVISGMDAVLKIQKGDTMDKVVIEDATK